MAMTTAIASVGLQAGSMYEQHQQQKEAMKKQEHAAELEQRKTAIANARERQKAAAQAQAMQSQVQAQQAAQSGSSTGTQQTLGAVSSQASGGVSFQRTIADMNNQQIDLNNSANQNLSNAATWQAIGQIPGQMGFGLGSIVSNWDTINQTFRGPQQPQQPQSVGMNSMRNY